MNPHDLFERRLSRGDLLRLGALVAGTGALGACGADRTAGGTEDGTTEAAEPPRPPIGEEPGNLRVFEWAGYEVPDLYRPYLKSGYAKPRFIFLESAQQALAKITAGFRADIVHPCNSYVVDYVETGTFQPWDPELIESYSALNPTLVQGHGMIDGQLWYVPIDWGYDSVLYRADKVEPKEESYNLLFDERYAGRISWWDNLYTVVIAALALGVDDPWEMTDAELDEVKTFLIEKKGIVRRYWTTQTDLDQDFQAGNVWIVGDAWGGSWAAAKAKGIDAVYMDPKEGRISWTCGFMLFGETENYHHAHEYVSAWASRQSGEWLIANYAYGHTNTTIQLSKVGDKLVEVFNLDDPRALQEERLDKRIPDRAAYAAAWDEIKAA